MICRENLSYNFVLHLQKITTEILLAPIRGLKFWTIPTDTELRGTVRAFAQNKRTSINNRNGRIHFLIQIRKATNLKYLV